MYWAGENPEEPKIPKVGEKELRQLVQRKKVVEREAKPTPSKVVIKTNQIEIQSSNLPNSNSASNVSSNNSTPTLPHISRSLSNIKNLYRFKSL